MNRSLKQEPAVAVRQPRAFFLIVGLIVGGWLLLPVAPSRLTEPARAAVTDRLRGPLGWLSQWGRDLWHLLHWRQLVVEVERLRRDRDRLISDLVRLQEASQENERLRSLLAFRQTFAERTVAARVIGQDPVRWSRGLILDRGRGAGVREGEAVIAPGGLVGRIGGVGAATSRVVVLTDPDCRVAGVVQRTREGGLAVGGAAGRLRLLYLPSTTASQPGDLVVTTGLGDGVPKGLLIGTIRAVRREVDGLSATAQVEPAVAVDRLEEVLVVVP